MTDLNDADAEHGWDAGEVVMYHATLADAQELFEAGDLDMDDMIDFGNCYDENGNKREGKTTEEQEKGEAVRQKIINILHGMDYPGAEELHPEEAGAL